MLTNTQITSVHCTKMDAASSVENIPNGVEFICPIGLPKPKSSGFQWKEALLGVRGAHYISIFLKEKKQMNIEDYVHKSIWSQYIYLYCAFK